MDASRFDALTRSLTRRRSRRGFAAGGLAVGLAALGVDRALAQPVCALQIQATTAIGPDQNTVYTGTLNFDIGEDGAIDSGSFDTDDGASHPLVGQAIGRALHLRITLGPDQVLSLEGTATNDLILCRGDASGTFGGPDVMDLGTWRTVESQSGATIPSGSSGTSNSNAGSSTNSNTSGNSSGGDSSSGDGSCDSGVVCGDVCCESMGGVTPVSIACNAGFCECTYSCASAGCDEGGDQGFIVVDCGSDPEPQCHNNCNFPSDNGCGDMTCSDTETLDVNSCTCIPNDGGDADGGCDADLMNDPLNCGFCGNECPSGQCIEGNCTDPVN
jgi:hypothetical protein